MVSFSKLGALLPAALFALQANAQSGTGVTTRYWYGFWNAYDGS